MVTPDKAIDVPNAPDQKRAGTVSARKDDVPAADQAATTNVAGLASFSGGGGLIQTTSG
jgi:hypothetical protein